jgi:modification methylase
MRLTPPLRNSSGKNLGLKGTQPLFADIQVIQTGSKGAGGALGEYKPRIQNSEILSKDMLPRNESPDFFKVVGLEDEQTIRLENGQLVRFLGVRMVNPAETQKYLQDYVVNKTVIVKDMVEVEKNGVVSAYVYLKNKIFINAYLIKSGLASPDDQIEHRLSHKFRRLAAVVKDSPTLSD